MGHRHEYPAVTIVQGDAALAMTLHDNAHTLCFVANSCSVPVRHEPTITEGAR